MMDHSAASAYVYAKASGMKADSFVGRKAQELFNARNLEDLWNLCFDEKVPLIPEVMLAKKIQKTAEDRFVSDYKMLIDCYEKPYGILIQLLRFYEYRNIKDIGAALCSGATQMPDIIDIGTFSMLDYSAWPDIAKITKDSPIAWYDRVPSWNDQKDFDCRLDIQYIKGLWKAVQELPRSEKKYTADFIQEYIVLENCVWAVRLRVYYNMQKNEIIPRLAREKKQADNKDSLAGHAIRILELPLDNKGAWEGWKYYNLLNESTDTDWVLDPIWFERAVNLKINKTALSKFHAHPFTAMVLVSWFKIKQNEVNMIRTAAEGLRLNVPDSQLKEFAGIQ